MPTGLQSIPALNPFTTGFRMIGTPPRALDVNLGPWEATDGTTASGVQLVNNLIVPGLRYVGQQVIIIANTTPGVPGGVTQGYLYWYRGGTANTDLVEFASGGIVGDYVTTFNGLTGAVTGVTVGGVNTFTQLNTFSAGISASGATLGTLTTNSGVTIGGRLDVGGHFKLKDDNSIFLGAGGSIYGNFGYLYGGVGSQSSQLNYVLFPNGFSAGGGITFISSPNFIVGLSAAGATLGTLTTNSGATVGGRLDVGGVLDVVGGVTLESTLDVVGAARFAGGLSAARVYVSQGSTFIGPVTFAGITATRVDTGTLATTGLATLNSLDVTNDATVGATLTVNGNFYVQGTLTTFNETQLLIQDKYLVLGSTLNTSSLADGAGVYVGATIGSTAIAGICYSHSGNQWSSSHAFNIPTNASYRIGGVTAIAGTFLGPAIAGSSLTSVGTISIGVWQGTTIGLAYGGTNKNLSAIGVSGGIVFKDGTGLSVLSSAGNVGEYLRSGGTDNVPTWASFSALTGLTADSVNITSTESVNATYFMTFVDATSGTRIMRADSGITYNPSTNTISCTQIEAIVDGGTW